MINTLKLPFYVVIHMREQSDQLLDGQHCVPLHLHMAK